MFFSIKARRKKVPTMLITILVLLVVMGLAMVILSNSSKKNASVIRIPVHIEDIQLYPNLVLTSKNSSVCTGEGQDQAFFGPCKKTTQYFYDSTDRFELVYHWYKDSPRNGWDCSGGGGDVNDNIPSAGTATSTCRKGSMEYILNLHGDTKHSQVWIVVATY